MHNSKSENYLHLRFEHGYTLKKNFLFTNCYLHSSCAYYIVGKILVGENEIPERYTFL